MLNQLTLEKLIKAQAAARSLALTENERNFHFSYMCRLKEQQLGVNGRAVSGGAHPIEPGDRLELGTAVATFEME